MRKVPIGNASAPAIRPAKLSDFDSVLGLIAAYYEFDSIAFDQRVTGRSLRRLLRDPALGRVWVVDASGALAGYAILTYNFDLEFGGVQGIITDFFIAPRYRRKGLGARTIAAVRKFCRQNRISSIELQVTRHNQRARAFYRALGFKALDRVVMDLDV